MSDLRKALVKRFGGYIAIGTRRFRRFILWPAEVNDGTSRCISCGQIDEPHFHLREACLVARFWPDEPPVAPAQHERRQAVADVVVTQEDREAAAALLDMRGASQCVIENILERRADGHHAVQAFARHRIAAEQRAKAQALACQPSTAENPNEDSYQRGRFDGIMEFATAISNMETSHAE